MTERAKIGKILKKYRLAAKFSQKEISTYVGVSQSNYSKFESGFLEPSMMQWLLFCRKTGAPLRAPLQDEA